MINEASTFKNFSVLAEALHRAFVGRDDCFAMQTSSGGYVKVDIPLTYSVIKRHLRGEITIGAYQLSQGNSVKWMCFDFDPEKLSEPKQAARKLLQACFEKKLEDDSVVRPRIWQHSVLAEASRYPDPSFHVWVLFSPAVPAKVARWLGLRLLELASLNPKEIEVFPKQTELSKEQPCGNLVKLPLGLHQVEKKWSCFLNLETFEPLPNEALLDCWGLSFTEADLEKIMGFEEKRHIQATFEPLPKKCKPLRGKEEKKAVEFLIKYWQKGRRNRLELAFLGYCIKRGVSYESARRVIERVCDLTNDEEKTARLRLVDYHYRNRKSLGSKLLASSGLFEIVREAVE